MKPALYLLPLPALREDNPRDFLAALGLLGALTLRWPAQRIRLAWDGPAGIPVISSEAPLAADWSAVLVADLQALNKHSLEPLRHGPIIKSESAIFRGATLAAVSFRDTGGPFAELPERLYSSYSSQMLAEKSSEVEPTAFSFGNGQSGKNLLLDVSQLLRALKPDELEHSLNGSAVPVAAKSLRWHPAEFRPAAHRGPDPGTKTKGDETRDFPALNVLACLGLTFCPCVPGADGGLTVGMVRENRQTFFRWPIWETPLDADSIRTLVALPVKALLHRPGIIRGWKSRRFSSDKSLYFARAEPA
jgi:hypothetical protein